MTINRTHLAGLELALSLMIKQRLSSGGVHLNALASLEDAVEQAQAAPEAEPVALSVWYGPMPESNGKSNYTAILHRKGVDLLHGCIITLDRSEYPDRVRYEADRARFLLGELDEEPCILDYDPDAHSGYTAPQHDADHIPDTTKMVDAELVELLRGLVAIADKKNRGRTGSPNHGHSVSGVWDSDNGELAGKPCAECAIYDHARAKLATLRHV